MDFTQTVDTPHERVWLDPSGSYRIAWHDRIHDVGVTPKYYALVRCRNALGFESWDFAGARRPYRTFERAKAACERHRKIWERAARIVQRKKKDWRERLAELRQRAKTGKGVTFQQILAVAPAWAAARMTPTALARIQNTRRPRARRDSILKTQGVGP